MKDDMASNMGWRDAIAKVLASSEKPLHYSAIAQRIIDEKFRTKVGATPSATVAATISSSLKQDGEASPFVRTDAGYYALRDPGSTPEKSKSELDEEVIDSAEGAGLEGLINAFGMYWARSSVYWAKGKPKLLGIERQGSSPVDFAEQAGVYLLYSGSLVVYVGRVTEGRLGARLWEHTRDRLGSRWDRFSWFGVRPVADNGELGPIPSAGIAIKVLIATLEALLIEGLEPPQNRRQGDGFSAKEFIQEVDGRIEEQAKKELLARLSATAGLQ